MKFSKYKRDLGVGSAGLNVACRYKSNEFSRELFCGQIVARRDEWRGRLAERLRIKSDFKYTALKARSQVMNERQRQRKREREKGKDHGRGVGSKLHYACGAKYTR